MFQLVLVCTYPCNVTAVYVLSIVALFLGYGENTNYPEYQILIFDRRVLDNKSIILNSSKFNFV